MAQQAHARRDAGMRRRRAQYEAMSAQCFSALALSMKMQMGDAARQLSITSLYNEAATQKVSGAARWSVPLGQTTSTT